MKRSHVVRDIFSLQIDGREASDDAAVWELIRLY